MINRAGASVYKEYRKQNLILNGLFPLPHVMTFSVAVLGMIVMSVT